MTHYLDFGGLAYFLQKLRETFTVSEWININADFDRFVNTKDVVTDFTQTDEKISVVFNNYDKRFIAFVPTGEGFYSSRWNECENYGDLDTTGVIPDKKMIYRCYEDNNLYTWEGHNLVAVTASSNDKYLRRDINDTARGIITFTVGTKWGSFSTESGAAMSVDNKGRSYLELDKLKVRLKAYFETLEIQQVTYVGGKLVITPGRGFVAQIVEDVETAYRCYYLAEQDGKEVRQTIEVDDFLMYKEFNVGPGVYEHVENRYYWRHVDAVSTEPISIEGKKYHWVEISKIDCDEHSDIPEVGDNLCQVGNRTQTDRQGAIIISTVDLNSPSITMYNGINDYTFTDRDFVEFGIFSGKSYTNIYGSAYIGDRKVDGKTPKGYVEWDNEAKTLRIKGSISFNSTFGDDSDRTIEDIFKAIEDSMADSYEYLEGYINDNMELIQSQVDKSITTWFYDDLPYPHISSNPDDQSTTSEPASGWTTDADKALHEGDLYYAKSHDRAFAWRNKAEYGYIWEEIYDANALKALRDAADAADLADHKRRVFVDTPIPPYDEGDMWVNATYPKTEDLKDGEEYRFFNDLARCIIPKTDEEEFSIEDWDLASKYTDDAMTLELGKDVQGALNAITDANKALDDIKNFADEAFRDNYVNASEANRLLSMVNNLKLSRLSLENQKDAVLNDPLFQRFVELSAENEAIKENLIAAWEAYDSKVTEFILLIETIAENAKSSSGMKITDEQRGEFNKVFEEVSSCQDALVKAIKQCEFGISQLLDSRVTQLANELGGYNYLREALSGTTYIEGGLILTSVIALGKRGVVNGEETFDVKSGISGLITAEPNEGAAFWAGGDRISIFDCDYDADNDVYYIGDTVVDPADAMIHHDGTAYFSKGSVRFLGKDEVFLGDWNKKTNYLHWKDGTLNIKGVIDLSSPTTYKGYTFSKLLTDINAVLQEQKAAIDETLPNLIDKVNKDLQSQIDGAIETYFYEGAPDITNKPWKDWIANEESLEAHIGDLYYDKLTGFAYRFQPDSTVQEGYSWQRLKDSEIENALSAAESAQETADGKMKVFYTQPTAPYQIGDLWVNAVFEGTDLSGNPVSYNNDLLRCNHENKDHFQIDDWCLASKYNYDEPIRQLDENITGVFDDLKKTNTLVDDIKNFTNEAFRDNYLSNTEKSILSEYRGQVTAAYNELLARITKVQEDVAAYGDNTAIDESVRQNIEERVGTPSNRTGTFITKYNDLISALDEVLKISGDMSAFEDKKEIYSKALEAYNDEVKQLSSLLFSLEHALYSAYLTDSEKKLYKELGNYKYLSEALGPHGGTILNKGLIMSQFLAMGMFRDNNNVQEFREWSGVSGVYVPSTSTSDVTKTEEHGGIAFWAGGEPYSVDLLKRQEDYEKFVYERVEWNGIPEYVYNLWDEQHTSIQRTLRPAKFLIYQDGTGYAAGGKIRFNEDGTITAESDSFYISVDKTNYQVGLTAAMFRYVLQDKTASNINWANVLAADLKKPLNGIDLFAKSYTVDHNVGGGSIQTDTYYSAIRFWNNPTSYNAVSAAPQSSIYYDPDQHAIHVQANLVVTGGITMYSTTGEISSGIMDSIVVDSQTIGIVNGALTVLSVPGLSVSDLKTLTITSGDSNLGTYTPTGSDVTINITPSNIGAADYSHNHSVSDITDLNTADFASKSHTHSVKINGDLKVIAASGGEAVDLGNYLVLDDLVEYIDGLSFWGQSFNGSKAITGNLTNVGTITPTGEDLKVVGNLIVTGGIVMYADDGASVESGFAALLAAHIDGATIKYNSTEQKIYSVMSGIEVNGKTFKPNDTTGIITLDDYPTSLDWSKIENKPTTIADYGITDANIVDGVITLGTATITPLTAHQTVTLASGTNNGTLKLTVNGTATDNIAVKGLGSAAYTEASAYAAASHTHSQYLVAASLDGYINALTDNTSTNVFVTAISKSGKTLSYTKSFTKKSLSEAGHSGWTSGAVDALIIPDMSFIAYWNGAYNSSGNSNLLYCAKGAFGDMATASKSSYYVKDDIDTKLTDGSVTKLGTANVGSGTQHFYLSGGTATASTSTVGSASKPVYLSGGSITACSYDFTSYLPLAGGTMNDGARIAHGGDMYIGNADNSGWVMFQDICSQSGSGDTYWSLRTNGTLHAKSAIISGDITASNATISSTLTVGAIPVTNSSTGILKIDGNLVVTGGITMYATDGVASGLMEQILVDGTTIKKKADGTLYVDPNFVGGGTVKGATVGGTAVTLDSATGTLQFPAYPTLSSLGAAAASHTHAYLPLSGGTMTGVIASSFNSDTWINGVTNAIIKATYTGYGAILSMPVKDGRVSLSSFPINDNFIYLGYASSAQISAGTNAFTKQMRWDAANNNLYADTFTGALAGNASTATLPYGFTSRDSDWAGSHGMPGTYITAWGASGGSIVFKVDGNHANVATDGYFYQGIDFYGDSLYRCLDTHDSGGYGLITTGNYSSYALPLSGGTMTGALNFKNSTWNLVGDDAYMGDCNVAGMIGIKGANAATPGFVLYNNSGTLLGKLYASGSNITWNGTALSLAGHTHSYLPLAGGTMTGALKINYNVTTSSPALAINYFSDYTVVDSSIGQIKFGTPTYDAYLGLSPAANGYFGKVGYFMHIGSSYEFLWATTNWTKRMALECSTGNLWVSGSVTATGFVKSGSSDSYFLLGGGGHKAVSDFATSGHTHSYLPLSGGTISGNLAATGKVTFLNEAKLKMWNVTSTRNSRYGDEMVFVQTSIDGADPETTWPDKNRNDLFLQPKGGHVHIGPIETAQDYTCYVAGTLRATDTITAPTFSGALSGNASSATKLTSSAGSATLPIYFSDGKPVACTASSVFSNLSNSGNNISVTVAGQNRTLTVGYASTSSMLKTSAWQGGAYASSDTHYMCLGYMNCTGSYDALTLLITSAFWGNQHGSQDIITIQQDTNTNGTKTVQPTVGRLRLGGSTERSFYYYKDNTNLRLYLYVYVTGGNSYGKWNISYLGGNAAWVTIGSTNVTKDSSWVTIGYSAQGNYATSSGNSDTCDGLHVHGGRNNEANKIVRTDGNGYIQCGYINSSSGNEGNNSSPARVWGTNGSDSYMRTYLTSALSVNYAASAGNADTVDGYHASSLWRSDGATWNPSANVSLNASANSQEWSFDIYRNGYTGCYWQVWDSSLSTMLKVNADNGKVYAPYNFVGTIEGVATSCLPLSGGTMTGTINANANVQNTGIKFNNNNANLNALNDQHLILGKAIRFGAYNTWDWNVWAGLKYDSSSKTIYLGLADGTTFNANNAQSGGSVKFPGINKMFISEIDAADGNGLLVYKPASWTGVSSSQTGVGTIVTETVIRSSNSNLKHYKYNVGTYDILDGANFGSYALPLAGGTMKADARISHEDGNMYLGHADNYGWIMCQDICSQNNEGDTYWSLRTNGTLHALTTYIGGHLWLNAQNASSSTGGASQLVFGKNGTQHVAVSSSTGAIIVNPSTSSYTGQVIIRVGASSTSEFAGNIKAGGGITMYSDLRKKNILSDEVLSVKEIAAAPLFAHTYKSDENHYLHIGTSAQYWSGIHEDWFTRKDSEGYYQMELQNLGVAMGISLAREVIKYESKTDKKIRLMKKKINDLEAANKALDARIKELEGSREERRTA